MPIALAFVAAITWGADDFFGGVWRRGMPVFVVVAVSQMIGVLLLVPILLARGTPLPDDPRLLFACVAGLGVTLELRLVYYAISRGEAFITAPVAALGATLAVVVGLLGGDPLSPGIAAGLACALLGGGASAWMSRGNGDTGSPIHTVGICLGAAVGLGTMLSCFHAAGRVDPYWSATILSASTALPAGLAAFAERRPLHQSLPRPQLLPGLTVIAMLGVAGDLAYATASRHGALTIVSAISSLYPLMTVFLGVTTQRRRARPAQAVGIAFAIAGGALLGATSH